MSDRDAFGNTINNPGEAMTAALPRPAAPAPRVQGSWDLWDKAAGLFMVLLFVVPLGIGGWFAYTSLHDARSHAIDVPALMHTVTPATPRATTAAPPRPAGLGLLRPAEVRRALAQHHGGVSVLRIDPLGADFVSAPGTGTIAKSTVDAHAPQRLITAAAHRLHVSRKTIDYVVLLKILGRPTWSAYFKSGAVFQADAHGRITRRIQ
ncbi:hypothetical protein [Conexibacter woesei]|uniref:hypothetical protein n=1 Tax=Conexibacter woesei TaxID=191495 RepID=UPI000414AA12|nr:hypothetical protein [Conexibacter woesei]